MSIAIARPRGSDGWWKVTIIETTTDATPVNRVFGVLNANGDSIHSIARVAALESGGGAGWQQATENLSVRNATANATRAAVDVPQAFSGGTGVAPWSVLVAPSWTVQPCVLSGNNVQTNFVGVAATTIFWQCIIWVYYFGTAGPP